MKRLWIVVIAVAVLGLLVLGCNDWDVDRSGFAATSQASEGTMAVLDSTAIYETVVARPTTAPGE